MSGQGQDRRDILARITQEMRKQFAESGSLDARLKFDYEGEGILFIDGSCVPNQVHNRDEDADCTVIMSLDTFLDLANDTLDPTAAFMQGRMRVKGDMGVAMKLGPILSRSRRGGNG